MYTNSSFPIDFDEDCVDKCFQFEILPRWARSTESPGRMLQFTPLELKIDVTMIISGISRVSGGPARSPHSQLLNCNTIQNSQREKKRPPLAVYSPHVNLLLYLGYSHLQHLLL